MPDAVPTPPLTRFQAQRKLGLFAPLDFTFIGVILFVWMTLGFWKFFGDPQPMNWIFAAILSVLLIQLWIIALAYRIMVFLLDLGADINLMPEAASRIVLGYWEGRSK